MDVSVLEDRLLSSVSRAAQTIGEFSFGGFATSFYNNPPRSPVEHTTIQTYPSIAAAHAGLRENRLKTRVRDRGHDRTIGARGERNRRHIARVPLDSRFDLVLHATKGWRKVLA